MDQPGKVANPARGQLNRENEYSPVPVREDLEKRVRRGATTPVEGGKSPLRCLTALPTINPSANNCISSCILSSPGVLGTTCRKMSSVLCFTCIIPRRQRSYRDVTTLVRAPTLRRKQPGLHQPLQDYLNPSRVTSVPRGLGNHRVRRSAAHGLLILILIGPSDSRDAVSWG